MTKHELIDTLKNFSTYEQEIVDWYDKKYDITDGEPNNRELRYYYKGKVKAFEEMIEILSRTAIECER